MTGLGAVRTGTNLLTFTFPHLTSSPASPLSIRASGVLAVSLLLSVPCLCWGGEGEGEDGEHRQTAAAVLTPSPSIAGVCPPQSQHRRHPQAALGKDTCSGDVQELCPTVGHVSPGLVRPRGSGSPLMLPPSVPSQVPALTADQPWPGSQSGRWPSAGPASRGNRSKRRGGHSTG